MRSVGVLASPTVGAKEVTIRVLKVPIGSVTATTTLGIFTVLARPANSQVSRITTVARVRGFPLLVESFEASPTVEAVRFSTLNSRYLAVVAEPAVRTAL